jgi:hypothetical protein
VAGFVFGWARHLRRRELRFLGLVALTLALILLYLDAGERQAHQEGRGWRTVDLDALKRRIGAGELSDREADWYRPQTPGANAGGEVE